MSKTYTPAELRTALINYKASSLPAIVHQVRTHATAYTGHASANKQTDLTAQRSDLYEFLGLIVTQNNKIYYDFITGGSSADYSKVFRFITDKKDKTTVRPMDYLDVDSQYNQVLNDFGYGGIQPTNTPPGQWDVSVVSQVYWNDGEELIAVLPSISVAANFRTGLSKYRLNNTAELRIGGSKSQNYSTLILHMYGRSIFCPPFNVDRKSKSYAFESVVKFAANPRSKAFAEMSEKLLTFCQKNKKYNAKARKKELLLLERLVGDLFRAIWDELIDDWDHTKLKAIDRLFLSDDLNTEQVIEFAKDSALTIYDSLQDVFEKSETELSCINGDLHKILTKLVISTIS